MGHPAIENATPFAFEPLFIPDEELRLCFVPLVKATFDIKPAGLAPAEKQVAVSLAGELCGLPGESSYRYEPECTLVKLATDVVLVGQAHAPHAGATEGRVALQVGPLKKVVRVVGDRVFFKAAGSIGLSSPAPFETLPLKWERAFGGWDRSDPDPDKHAFEPRNPVGRGFRARGSRFEEGLLAPNLEDPSRPFKGWGDRTPPAGFGFISPDWEPRCKLAGTYDAAWDEKRKPLLPSDFDRRFFNAASPGLVSQGYLRGDEAVEIVGASPGKGLSFKLPGLPPPLLRASGAVGDLEVPLHLDTVILDTEEMKVFLFWRGLAPLDGAPTDLTDIEVRPGDGRAAQG